MECHEPKDPEYTGWATAEDECDQNPTVTYTDTLVPGPCPHSWTILRNWVATDACGNRASGVQRIAVKDTTAPELSVPPDRVVRCHEPKDPDHTGWATAQDNCDPNPRISYADSLVPGSCAHSWTIERTWRAEDACGNKSQAVQRIEVVDDVPPSWAQAMPGDLVLECDAPVPPPPVVRATDNCDPSPTVTYEEIVDLGGCGGYTGAITRIWRATDACGNEIEHRQVIGILDTKPPILTLPPDVVVECHESTDPDRTGWATARDNCDSNPEISYSDEVFFGPCPFFFTIKRTWAAIDACGNKANGVQTITVRDTTAPQITCPENVDLGCNPADTSPKTTGWAIAQDNCDPNPNVTYTDSVSAVGCRTTITRTWQARDSCGNASQCSQIITYISDATPTTILCPGDVVEYTHSPPGSTVWVSFPRARAQDTCDPNPSISCTPSGGWFVVGTTSPAAMTCTAADACGNTTSQDCQFWVTVEFVCPPLIANPDTANCDGSPVAIPVLANDKGYELRLEGFDPPRCGNAWAVGNVIYYTTMGWSPSCPPPYRGLQETFSYTVRDGCGNVAVGWVTVTITCDICPLALPGQEGG